MVRMCCYACMQGVTYATQKLGALSNVAIYLDIAHSGWLGWYIASLSVLKYQAPPRQHQDLGVKRAPNTNSLSVACFCKTRCTNTLLHLRQA